MHILLLHYNYSMCRSMRNWWMTALESKYMLSNDKVSFAAVLVFFCHTDGKPLITDRSWIYGRLSLSSE